MTELRLSTDRMDKEGIKVQIIPPGCSRSRRRQTRRIALGTGVLATIGSTGPFV